MERFHRQKLFQDVYQAASNSSGGRKMSRIRSGLTVILGTVGIKLIPSPPMTKKIGYEMLMRWLSR